MRPMDKIFLLLKVAAALAILGIYFKWHRLVSSDQAVSGINQLSQWMIGNKEQVLRYTRFVQAAAGLSSHVWRQDHNGFTHQDPGFIDLVMNKKAEIIRVYLPPDANCLLSVMDHCLRSRHYVNVVVAGKHPAPQWLTMDEAVRHCEAGIGTWAWASSDR